VHERDVHQCIYEDAQDDGDGTLLFKHASQNLTATAVLLRGCPEPATPKEKGVRQQLKALLETAVVQQTESSTLRQQSACEPMSVF
jgi:hypothetical protein